MRIGYACYCCLYGFERFQASVEEDVEEQDGKRTEGDCLTICLNNDGAQGILILRTVSAFFSFFPALGIISAAQFLTTS